MIHIIDTYSKIDSLFISGTFDINRWEEYINGIYADSADIFKNDMQEYLKDGTYSFEKDFLPIIQNVYRNEQLDVLHNSFLQLVGGLNEKIEKHFGKEINADIVLYLGLCNAAGWVTTIGGRKTILLGIEKILELNWQNTDAMNALIYHELGHVYHMQYGIFKQEITCNEKRFVWQLFTEGIAMYFEQVLAGDLDYYHQDINGWKKWCKEHLNQIIHDFNCELPNMTRQNQHYFGDWSNYNGFGDVGYYLGTKFVHSLIEQGKSFDALINMNTESVYEKYLDFVANVKC